MSPRQLLVKVGVVSFLILGLVITIHLHRSKQTIDPLQPLPGEDFREVTLTPTPGSFGNQ